MASPAYMAAGKMPKGMLRGMPGGMPSEMTVRRERGGRAVPIMVRKKREIRKEKGGLSQAAPYSLDAVSCFGTFGYYNTW